MALGFITTKVFKLYFGYWYSQHVIYFAAQVAIQGDSFLLFFNGSTTPWQTENFMQNILTT